MITVTRLNKTSITINAEMIEFVVSSPDTIITTSNGKKIIITDSVEEVIEKIIQYKQRCFQHLTIDLRK